MIVLAYLPNSTPEFAFLGKDCIDDCWGFSIEWQVAFSPALPGGTFVILWSNYLKSSIWMLWPFLFCKFEGVEAMGRHGLVPITAFCPSVFSQLLKSWSTENEGKCDLDVTYSTVKYVPDPRRFISFLLSYSRDEKSAFQHLRCPCSDREWKSPFVRSWRNFCDGQNEWEGNTDFVTPIIRGGWLLAQLAVLILKVLSLTRPRVQMSSQIQLFSVKWLW